MHNLWEYGLWLVLVTINAIVVSQQINHLILVSGGVAGIAVGFFLTIFAILNKYYYLRPSFPSAFSRVSPPTLDNGRPESVTHIATIISFDLGASLILTSIPSKWERT